MEKLLKNRRQRLARDGRKHFWLFLKQASLLFIVDPMIFILKPVIVCHWDQICRKTMKMGGVLLWSMYLFRTAWDDKSPYCGSCRQKTSGSTAAFPWRVWHRAEFPHQTCAEGSEQAAWQSEYSHLNHCLTHWAKSISLESATRRPGSRAEASCLRKQSGFS